tara:strand:- start:248 stop:694 length:447 start_codon:yes stop_codon:yes gene_type:complete
MKSNFIKIAKKVLLTVLFVFFLPYLAYCSYASDIFKELTTAIREDAIKVELKALEAKYLDKRIEGKGYIKSITHDLKERVVLTVSTLEDVNDVESVSVVIYLRKYTARTISRFKVGDKIRLFGDFKGIRMKTIVVEETIIKPHYQDIK